MSSVESERPGGQPSTTQPIAVPWLSPNDVTVKILPKVLQAMRTRGLSLFDQVQFDAQFLELIRTHCRRRIGQRALRFLGLGKCNDISN